MLDPNTEAQKYGGSQRIIRSELTYKIIGAAVVGIQRQLEMFLRASLCFCASVLRPKHGGFYLNLSIQASNNLRKGSSPIQEAPRGKSGLIEPWKSDPPVINQFRCLATSSQRLIWFM